MFSKKNLYHWSGSLIVLGIILLLFFGPMFRGVIYPTERALFGIFILSLWLIQELRQLIKSQNSFKFEEWLEHEILLPSICLLLATVSLLINYNVDGLVRLADFFSLYLVYLLTRKVFARKERRETVYKFIVFTGAFHAVLGFVYLLNWLPHPWWEKLDFLSGTFVNHNHYAGLLELIFFLVLGRCLAQRQEKLKVNILGLMVIWLALLLSLSRGAWISMSISLLLATFILIKHNNLRQLGLRILATLGMIVLLVMAYLSMGFNPSMNERFASFRTMKGQFEFFDFRVKLWRSTIDAISDRPLLGHGPGSFEWAMRPYRQKGFEFAFDYAHNDWLQFTMECGVMFILLVLIFFYNFFRNMLHSINTEKLSEFRFEEFGLRLGVFCLLVHSFVDFNLHIFSNAVLFVVFLGLSTSKVRN